MKTTPPLLRLLLIAALAPVGSFSFAGEPVPPPETNSATAPLAQRAGRINFNFSGGTLGQFVTAISREQSITFNLIGAGSPAEFETELPPFALHNVTGVIVAQVLRGLLESRGYDLQISPTDENTVTCVLAPLTKNKYVDSSMQDQFQSFELSPYLVNFSVEQIVDAIRSAWDLNPAHPRDGLRVKFHPGTGILLVSGPWNAITMAQDIIGNLRKDPLPNPPAPSPAAKP